RTDVQTTKKRRLRRRPENVGSKPFFVFFVSSWFVSIFAVQTGTRVSFALFVYLSQDTFPDLGYNIEARVNYLSYIVVDRSSKHDSHFGRVQLVITFNPLRQAGSGELQRFLQRYSYPEDHQVLIVFSPRPAQIFPLKKVYREFDLHRSFKS